MTRWILVCFAMAASMAWAKGSEAIVVAHRGASAYAPENTLPAFELAWRLGADAIEGDFHLTRDGEIVCIHDYTIERYTGAKRAVAEMSLAELQALDVGRWKGKEWSGTRPPSLAEVLATVPAGKRIFVEVKCGPEIAPALLETLARSGLEPRQVVVIAFDAAVVGEVKARAPQYEANWLIKVKPRLFWRDPGKRSLRRTLEAIQADGISTKANAAVRPGFVRWFREAGFGYHVWTVDDADAARRFAGMGVGSITTNTPDVTLEALGRESGLRLGGDRR